MTLRQLILLATIFLAPWLSSGAQAAPPDLTAGEVPGDSVTINLGPTGMRGWVYHSRIDTGESRQILVSAVASGSPADGVIAVDDVILGADGTGSTPVLFSSDARRSLAGAIADAEVRTPATLQLLRWRAGVTSSVSVPLVTMGAYSATAPYNCPKSARILDEGIDYFFANEDSGRYTFGALALLAADDPTDPDHGSFRARLQAEAHALIPSASERVEMMSDEWVDPGFATWQRGHALIFLAEYFLVTGDPVILPAVEAYAVNIAKNLSLFGTAGHRFAGKTASGGNNGSIGTGYGAVNSAGMPCFLGLLLARECGLVNPEIEPVIESASRFYAYYAGKGAIPYGEHEPYAKAHETNGKSGLAAVAFGLEADRVAEGQFFAKMATGATSERELGHTGSFFNYLWSPLGAAAGGEEAAAAHFARIKWMLDLNRRWDGGFDYDCLNGEGPNSGSTYHNFKMSTPALLVYALPLRKLHMTGRNHDPARWLSSVDVSEAVVADDYEAGSRTISELIGDLGNWSPKVQKESAEELGARSIDAATLAQITALAGDQGGTSRIGACRALGRIGDADSAGTLVDLLTDPENHVRFHAAEALRYLPTSAKLPHLDTILAVADSNSRPLVPYDQEDPLHFAHGRLGMLLFYSGNAYGPKGIIWNDLTGVDRNLLYPAIRAVAANPIGQVRSTLKKTYENLSHADTLAVADAIVDSVAERSPADKMFSSGVRLGGLDALERFDIAEGVPLAVSYAQEDGWGGTVRNTLAFLEDYAGSSTTVVPDPEVVAFCEALLGTSDAAEAQAVLDAIAADPNPIPLTPLKEIVSVTADSSELTLPSNATTLRATAVDHAQGESIFTWRKVHGAGAVTFVPNGTGAAVDTTITIEPVPGLYLFEVSMSDSRQLTEVAERVYVTVYDAGGGLPANDPPIADPGLVSVSQASPRSVTLTGSDPEGFPLVLAVTGHPTHGYLTGDVPNLVYHPDPLHIGADSFTFEVMDSEGQVDSATVDLVVNAVSSFAVSIHEPFDYGVGEVAGQNGGVGFAGPWVATRNNPQVVAGSNLWGGLAVSGNRLQSQSWNGLTRPLGTTLADDGLLNNGATLWFSYVMDITGQNLTNLDYNVALCAEKFEPGDYGNKTNLVGGEGIGVGNVTAGEIRGAYWQNDDADPIAERHLGETSLVLNNSDSARTLIVGKIEWGATDSDSEVLTLYAPGPDLVLEDPVLASWETPALDQSLFDALSIQWKDSSPSMDEIRFGHSYASVLFGSAFVPSDYDLWAAAYPGVDLADSAADLDSDGFTNDEERIWGLDPTSGSSPDPVSIPLNESGALTYTRRDPALTGLTFTVWYSTDLASWQEDNGAVQTPGPSNGSQVETVLVTLSPNLPNEPRLFVKVRAAE